MLPMSRTSRRSGQCCAAIREQGDGDADQTVEAEFLQHARVQHRGGRGRGGIGRRRPCVEWKERNENAEADQQEQVNGSCAERGIDEARACCWSSVMSKVR